MSDLFLVQVTAVKQTPYHAVKAENYAKDASRKGMLETQTLSDYTQLTPSRAGRGPPRPPALKSAPW